MNRFPLVFGADQGVHDSGLKAFLLTHRIPVSSIKDTSKKDGRVSIKLDDSSNEFTPTLLLYLGTALDDLKKRIHTVTRVNFNNEQLQSELDRVFISQMDYTQDLLGFFIATDVKDVLEKLTSDFNGSMLPSKKHKQLMTCLQFLDGVEKTARIKIYTKSIHLLTCGQFKKWIDMRTKELFKPSQAFFDKKIQPSQGDGLTRIEVSMYFDNHGQWSKQVDEEFKDAKSYCSQILMILNKHSDGLSYKIPLNNMVSSYFKHALSSRTIVSFEKDVWVIAYYFNGRSYTYTGHEVNRTSKSGSMLNFLKRYLFPGQKCIVLSGGELLGECQKKKGKMQLPISSLNEKHIEEYELGLDPMLSYHLDENDLEEIQIVTVNSRVRALLDIPDLCEQSEEERKSEDINYESALPRHPLGFTGATLQERRHVTKRLAPLPLHEVARPPKPKCLHQKEHGDQQKEEEVEDVGQEKEEIVEKKTKCCFCGKSTGVPIDPHWLNCEPKARFTQVINRYARKWKPVVLEWLDAPIPLAWQPQFTEMFAEILQELERLGGVDEGEEKAERDIIVKLKSDLVALQANNTSIAVQKQPQRKREEKSIIKQQETQRKTKAGAIIREVFDEDWIVDGRVIEGKKKRKTFRCKQCGKAGVRSNDRKVHACPSSV